jgi:hypothetical protein
VPRARSGTGDLYCFDRISPRTRKAKREAFDYGQPYRGYQWFDRYSTAQLTALGDLVDDLCTRFAIPLARFKGVIGQTIRISHGATSRS